MGGGVGGTILYAKWDHKFRTAVETNVPYADWLLGLTLGPASQARELPFKKQVRIGPQQISAAARSIARFRDESVQQILKE